MYTPKHFKVDDLGKILDFLHAHSFGTLYHFSQGAHSATHLPFVIESKDNHIILSSHFAKANPQWKNLDEQEALIVFLGPHAYISSEWYDDPKSVPTWNYVSIHLTGKIKLMKDEADLEEMLGKLVTNFERPNSAWTYEPKSEFNKGLHQAIVGFTVEVTKVESKWKLSQNHSLERKQKVIKKLIEKGDDNSKHIAELMQQAIKI